MIGYAESLAVSGYVPQQSRSSGYTVLPMHLALIHGNLA
jgi:hypothetical protein